MEDLQREPRISIGVIDGTDGVTGRFNAPFTVKGQIHEPCGFRATTSEGAVVLTGQSGRTIARGPRIALRGRRPGTTFDLLDVVIGRLFHWERSENHTFPGDLILQVRPDGKLVAINVVSTEDYLKSVISSEMNAQGPAEFLRAHAILSRSWLLATLEGKQSRPGTVDRPRNVRPNVKADSTPEIIKWYDGRDHDLFDVCADDHCQRYHGLTKITSGEAYRAVEDTEGDVMIYGGAVCDARYSKACGGLTERYSTAWDNVEIPYLDSVCDSPVRHNPVHSEEDAEQWIRSTAEAYCQTADRELLSRILPDFDRETKNFFRWTVEYSQGELSDIMLQKTGIDFGQVKALVPLSRGPSGRVYRLLVEGTKERVVVGKELEIRRWLSTSHLYSSAFVAETRKGDRGLSFVLKGAGWGHGVGLCQVGAAVMASQGFRAGEILKHYFRGVEIQKAY